MNIKIFAIVHSLMNYSKIDSFQAHFPVQMLRTSNSFVSNDIGVIDSVTLSAQVGILIEMGGCEI